MNFSNYCANVFLGFAVSDDEDISSVVNAPQDQTKVRAAIFPFLTSKDTHKEQNKDKSGTYRVVADPDRETVQLKDCKDQFPP